MTIRENICLDNNPLTERALDWKSATIDFRDYPLNDGAYSSILFGHG